MAANKPKNNQMIDKDMLALLVCPLTKQALKLNTKQTELISVAARLAYPVRGSVPILLPSEARQLLEKEL